MRHKNSTHVQKTTKTVHMYKKIQKQTSKTKIQNKTQRILSPNRNIIILHST